MEFGGASHPRCQLRCGRRSHDMAARWAAARRDTRRLGRSVETLVSTYVGALDDEERVGSQRVERSSDRRLVPNEKGSQCVKPAGIYMQSHVTLGYD